MIHNLAQMISTCWLSGLLVAGNEIVDYDNSPFPSAIEANSVGTTHVVNLRQQTLIIKTHAPANTGYCTLTLTLTLTPMCIHLAHLIRIGQLHRGPAVSNTLYTFQYYTIHSLVYSDDGQIAHNQAGNCFRRTCTVT